MKHIYFSTIALAFFLLSCQHRTGQYRFEGNLLYTLKMYDGSYWVFRDSITHSIDTLKYKFGYWGFPTDRDYSNQIQSFEFSNESAPSSYRKIKFEFDADAEARSLYMIATYTNQDTFTIKTGSLLVYQEPFHTGRIKSFGQGYYESMATYNEYELLSKNYLTVFQAGQFYWDTIQPYSSNVVWYSMHDKVIKLRMQTHERLVVLELIDHNIVR
jgi:hypothetical protein